MVLPLLLSHYRPPCGGIAFQVGLCRNPSLGFVTKAKVCKVAGQEGDLGALHMLPGVQTV
jgi:hypothetical protein